jgi:hypothetical protein
MWVPSTHTHDFMEEVKEEAQVFPTAQTGHPLSAIGALMTYSRAVFLSNQTQTHTQTQMFCSKRFSPNVTQKLFQLVARRFIDALWVAGVRLRA